MKIVVNVTASLLLASVLFLAATSTVFGGHLDDPDEGHADGATRTTGDPTDTTSRTTGDPTDTTGRTTGDPTDTIEPGEFSGRSITLFDPIEKSITEIFRAILDIIMVFAIPIIVFFIIWAGFLYVTAGGDTAKISQATKALTYAVIGGVIVLGANVLLEVITSTIEAFI